MKIDAIAQVSSRHRLCYQNLLNDNFSHLIEYHNNTTEIIFLDGYAPFMSMTIRDSFLSVPDHVIAAPGPGHYDVSSIPKVRGGSTIGNKGNRFESDQTFVPGPGSYNVTKYNEMGKAEPNFGFSINEVSYPKY